MKALTRLVAATAAALCATVAIGCDNHATPIIDTTSTTGADLNAVGAADMRDAGASSAVAAPLAAPMAAPRQPLPPPIELDAPVATAPVLAVPPVAPSAPRAPVTTSGGNGPASTFVGTSFGPTPADTSTNAGSNP